MKFSSPSCNFCSWSSSMGRSQCLSCGRAVLACRDPNEDERWITSPEARLLRLKEGMERASGSRSRQQLDLRIWTAIQESATPLAEFTAHGLARITDLHVTAVRHCLKRLERSHRIVQTGTVAVRSNRIRPKFKVMLPFIRLQ